MSNMYAGLARDLAGDSLQIKRCSGRLLEMRKSLADVRARKSDGSLLLATWNIRDFDSNKFGFGPRLPETFYYIAEIISCFDLVAVQEVNRDMSALEKVMRILGREWQYIATDVTEGPGGNQERMAFLYNREKVWFRGVASDVVLPDTQLVVTPKNAKKPGEAVSIETDAKQQFARSPFLVTFQSGWFRFSLSTVHIYYGSDSGAQLIRRIGEIKALVKFFADRQDKEADLDRLGAVENYILLGDFNVVSPQHETMKALKSERFVVPDAIDGDKVRKKGQHFYDQIAVRVKDKRFKVTGGGMVDIFKDVFRDGPEDMKEYEEHLPKKDPEEGEFAAKTPEALYRKWRTWQMSDHSPLWVEISTDFADDYLTRLRGE